MATEVQEFRINVTGQQQASQRVTRFQGTLGNLSKSATAASGRVGGVAGAVGNVGTVMSATNPAIAGFAGVIGTAGSAVGGLTSALGGPAGLLAGGVIAALGIFVQTSKEAEEQQRSLNDALEDGTGTLEEYVSALRKRAKAEEEQLRLRTGAASVEMLEAEGERLESQMDALNRSISALRDASQDTSRSYDEIEGATRGLNIAFERQDELQQKLLDNERNLRIAREKAEAAARTEQETARQRIDQLERENAAKGSARGAGGGRTTEDFRVEGRVRGPLEGFVPGVRGRLEGREAPSAGALESRRGLGGLGSEILEAQSTFGLTADIEEQQQILESRREAAQERIALAEEAAAREQQLAMDVSATWQDASTNMATSMGSAVNALIQGNDQAVGAILQGIGSQSIAHGTQAILRAAVEAAFGNPAAGAAAASGAALVAFGASLGGVGSAAGGASGAGVARPTAPRDTTGGMGRGQGGGGNITVNIRGIADARTGEQVIGSLRQLQRERGAGAVKV